MKNAKFTHKGVDYKVIGGNLYEVTDTCLLGAHVDSDGDLRTIAKANGWTGNIEDKIDNFHNAELRKQTANFVSIWK